jgi:hypothetical protein
LIFKECFGGWTSETFKDVHTSVRVALRNALRRNGVFVDGTPILRLYDALVILLQEEEQADWPRDEIDKEIRRGGFNSWRNYIQYPEWSQPVQRLPSGTPSPPAVVRTTREHDDSILLPQHPVRVDPPEPAGRPPRHTSTLPPPQQPTNSQTPPAVHSRHQEPIANQQYGMRVGSAFSDQIQSGRRVSLP